MLSKEPVETASCDVVQAATQKNVRRGQCSLKDYARHRLVVSHSASSPAQSGTNDLSKFLCMMESILEPSSDGQSASSSSKRLPVNPRRHKVAPDQRKRVVRACNACNNRRVKCTGEQPCERCVKTSRECEYSASETDRMSIKDELERLRIRCAAMEEGLRTLAPQYAPDLLRQLNRGEAPSWPDGLSFTSDFRSATDSDDVQGRFLHDPDGAVRYLGESSGATFLDQLKQFIRTLTGSLTFAAGSEDGASFAESVGSYQTYDSRPLPNPVVDAHWLPAQPEMAHMLHELCQYIQDGNGTFRSGGIHWWGSLSNPPIPSGSPKSFDSTAIHDSHRHLAFYNACFALSVWLRHSSSHLLDLQSSQAYFKRARMLLGNPLDTVHFTLDDVPALSLMGYYLIEVNRRDTAYMYVSLAVHTAIIHGSFKRATDEPSKRTLWTLYIMDRWISMLMGRPPIIPDEAIRLPLPTADPSLPPCVGLRANIELARISGYIVRETYRIAPRYAKTSGPEENIDEALKMLHDWRSQLPAELQLSPGQPLHDPACCTLHMGYNQLITMTTRPTFFAAIKKVVAQRMLDDSALSDITMHETHTRSCTEAAQRNLELARLLQSKNMNWLQSGLHFLFNAAVILLLNRIYLAHRDLVDTDTDHGIEGQNNAEIDFAIGVFEQEAKTGTNYPQDCCRVLQDLKALTNRYTVMQQQPHLQQGGVHRNISASNQQPGLPSQHGPLQGSDHGYSFYKSLMDWAQSDGLRLQDALHI